MEHRRNFNRKNFSRGAYLPTIAESFWREFERNFLQKGSLKYFFSSLSGIPGISLPEALGLQNIFFAAYDKGSPLVEPRGLYLQYPFVPA